MPVELRVNSSRVAEIVIACHYCDEVINVEEGLTIWLPGNRNDAEDTFLVDYAHKVCEDRFLSSCPAPAVEALKKLNTSIARLLEMLSETC